LSELTDMTDAMVGTDEFIVLDAGADRRKAANEIGLSIFNNDAGFTTNVGDITGVTAGTYLTGGGTSGAVTLNVDATTTNTASKVVARDGSGNFSAGTITATLSGNATTSSSTTGNAATATTLQTARTINGVSFNGSANITVADSTKLPLTGGTLTGALAGTTITATTLQSDSLANGSGVGKINYDSSTYFSGAFSDEVNALGSTGTAKTINCSTGTVVTATLTGNCTFTLSTPNSTGSRATSFTLILTNDGTAGRTVVLSGGTFKYPGGSISRSTEANYVDIWFFFSPDGGTTWYVTIPAKNLST